MISQTFFEHVKLHRLVSNAIRIEKDENGNEKLIGNPVEVLVEQREERPTFDEYGTIKTGWEHNCITLADILPREVMNEPGKLEITVKFTPDSLFMDSEAQLRLENEQLKKELEVLRKNA
jgi:hypothetical protein